jgi:hypothetical protein
LLLVVAAEVVATRHVVTVGSFPPSLPCAAVVALFVVAVAVVDRNWPLSSAMDRRRRHELLLSSHQQEQKMIVNGKNACFATLDRVLMSNAVPTVKGERTRRASFTTARLWLSPGATERRLPL